MALPVTRSFTGVTGNIPTADETAWAYNRNTATPFVVSTNGSTHVNCDNTSDTAMHWTGDSFNNDHYSEVTLATITNTTLGTGFGPAVRMDTGTTQKTMYRLVCSTLGWELVKFVNAATTSLASNASPAFATGDVVRLTATGSNLTMSRNGTPFGGTVTDSALTTGAAGVGHSSTSKASDTSTGIDIFTAGNVGGAPLVSGKFAVLFRGKF